MKIKIRKIVMADRKKLLKIIKDTGVFSRSEINVAMELIDQFLNDKKQKDYIIFASEEDGKITGYVCYGPTPATEGTYDLYWIAVSPEMQNKGIGRKLLRFVEDRIISRKGRMIIIETSSLPAYLPTREFYIRNGYSVEAEIADFYRNGDNRVIYVKRLEQTT